MNLNYDFIGKINLNSHKHKIGFLLAISILEGFSYKLSVVYEWDIGNRDRHRATFFALSCPVPCLPLPCSENSFWPCPEGRVGLINELHNKRTQNLMKISWSF
jgi:hypothetical protein